MFLDILLRDNPALADYSLYLYRKRLIQPDTYVIDMDAVGENISRFQREAGSLSIFPMTKQLGRNPWVLDYLKNEGFSFCAVDFREALTLIDRKCPLGHVGHLVQIPQGLVPFILEQRPRYATLYSLEQARFLNGCARGLGIKQNVFLRSIAQAYPAQESIIHSPESLLAFAREVQSLSHLSIAGLTSFPCFLFEKGKIQASSNARLLNRCFDILQSEGIMLEEKNMPSHNSLEALPLMKEYGATQAEPGHALTGTCPSHGVGRGYEKIALCYVTEISHQVEGVSYAFGGGWYRRSHWGKALIEGKKAELIPPSAENIDYTYAFRGKFPAGSSVLASFRTQIFTTRSQTAAVAGLSQGKPQLLGTADALGREISCVLSP